MQKWVFILFAGFFLVLTPPALAQSTRVQVSNLNHLATILAAAHRPDSSSVAIRPGLFTTYVNGLGRLSFDFNEIRKSTVVPEFIGNHSFSSNQSPIVLMKGWAMLGGTPIRAAGMLSYENGRSTLTVDFPHTSKVTGDTTLYRIVYTNLESAPKISIERTKSLHFSGAACGNDVPLLQGLAAAQTAGADGSGPATSNATLKEVQISVSVDAAYISKFGSSSSYIEGLLNAAEAIYEDDLGLTFRLVRILFDNNLSFSSGEGSTLLIDFADYIDLEKNFASSADVFHVFTGKDLLGEGNSNVIGVAFFGFTNDPDPGVVCRPDRFSSMFGFRPAAVGATERSSGSTAGSLMVTFAHEMGHNFAAEHTDSGVMTASLDFGNLPGSFSNTSKNQISTFIGKHGSCLADEVEEDPDAGDDDDDDNDDSDDDSDSGSGGGGSGGGADGNVPEAFEVNFNHTLSEEGLFTATITIEDDPGDDCYFRILMDKAKNNGRGILVASTLATDRSHTFITQVLAKAKRRNARGRRLKIWATGVYECNAGEAGASGTVQVKAHRIKVRRRVGPKRWIKLLHKAFL